jgi:membrane protease YdiL (CAAX protease family)
VRSSTLLTEAPDDQLARDLRGFGPSGILAILAIYAGNILFRPLSAILVLAWAWRSRTPWRDIGYVFPAKWARALAIGIPFGIVFKLVMKAVVMPLLGADPANQAYHYLVGNTAALPGALYIFIVGAGFGEETLFRGFMFERLGRLLGHTTRARVAIVLLTTVWFASLHFPDQGLAGFEQALFTGLAFGTILGCTGRIWTIMVAHAAFDLTAVAIIYLNLESTVAHLILK